MSQETDVELLELVKTDVEEALRKIPRNHAPEMIAEANMLLVKVLFALSRCSAPKTTALRDKAFRALSSAARIYRKRNQEFELSKVEELEKTESSNPL
ncbi:MAG: hypothetical protein R3C11_19005 [Planctomycetaceae bacterium]